MYLSTWYVHVACSIGYKSIIMCISDTMFLVFVSRDSVDVLFPLFLSNLEDSIPSVRQGAAVAIAQLLAAYGEPRVRICGARAHLVHFTDI